MSSDTARNRIPASVTLAIVAVVVAAALLGAAAVRTNGDDGAGEKPSGPSSTAPVAAAARACSPFGTKQVDASSLSVGNVTLQSDTASSGGSNEAARIPGGKAVPDLTVKRPGQWASTDLDAKPASAVALNADGKLAPFSTAFAATRPRGGVGGGLAAMQCPQSSSRAWFVGAGSTANHPGTLVLSNPTDVDAVVDVALYAAKDEVEVVGGSGIVVESGAAKQVSLDELGTGEDELGVAVTATQGTVSASVLDGTGELNAYDGSEYLPIATHPSTTSVVAGVPGGSDKRKLLVLNPGDNAANVSLTVVGKDGTSKPSGLESISVGAGSIKVVDLPDELADSALSLRLQSKVPVTAAVRVISDGDIAYAAANEAVREPSAVPVRIGDALDDADLRIAASAVAQDTGGAVRVRAHKADGSAIGKQATVKLGAGTTKSIDPIEETGASRGKAAYVTVSPSGSAVRASATYRDGDDVSVIPLVELPSTVVRPAVAPGTPR
ncbi:MAG TPA: DUF5719 family protein [Nocardioidaceae bacterium]|nr:DUF5719 family protein [Nocardioidaceae bacterium]